MKRRMQSGNGPLMTDHLRDLDLELQLLKRKRSMIEQQQRMLSEGRQQPYQQDFDLGYQRNFANLYEDDHHRGQPAGSQFGQNYHSDAIWDHQTPQAPPPSIYSAPQPARYEFSDNRNDRFAAKKKPRRPNPWANPTPLLNTPISAPHFSQSGPKPTAKQSRVRSREGPPKRRNDFKPDKVTKTKPAPSPINTLKHQSVQNRKELIKKSSSVVTPRKSNLNERYYPDKTPSNQVVGRMEFCLGMVLKDIRSTYASSHPHIVNDPGHIRTIKEAIRERVQEVMLGKVVSGNTVVIEHYRAKYPVSTDKEIVDLCTNADLVKKHKQRVKPFLAEDDPEKFFKYNFHKLFVKQLDDMFAKIALLHKQQNKKNIDQIIKELPDLTVDGKGLISVTDDKDKDVVITIDDKDKDVVITIDDKEKDVVITNTENTNEAPKDTEDQKETTKSEAPAEVVNETPNKEVEASEKTETAEKDTTQEPTVETSTTENEMVTGDENKKALEKMDNAQKTKFYINLLDKLIEQRLPHYIRKKRNEILDIMNIDLDFKVTRAAVILATNKKAEKIAKVPSLHYEKSPTKKAEAKQSAAKVKPAEKPDATQTNQKKLLYVKILAKPNLPETSVMKAFLDGFNPKLIKKPRTVPNLLIIGLSEEKDYESLLAANGKIIGEKTLHVTKSERINAKKNNEKTVKAEDKPIIPDDLDNQITDLLSSIRKAEESETQEGSTINVNTEEKDNDANKVIPVTNEEISTTVEPQTDVGDANDAKTNKNITVDVVKQEKPIETTDNEQTQPMETADVQPIDTTETKPIENAENKPMDTDETKPVETVSETVATNENGDKNVQVAKTVENIQKQENVAQGTPTRSSGRVTRSKIANP